MGGEKGRLDNARYAVWGVVVACLAGMRLATHIFVILALDSVLIITLAYVLAKADAGCRGWGAAFLGCFVGAAVPFVLLIALGDRLEPFMSRHGVDTLVLPFLVLMVVMPTACVLCAWLGAACTRSLRKRNGACPGDHQG